jgi:hypothetical protein
MTPPSGCSVRATSAVWTARPADHHARRQCINTPGDGDDARWIIKTVSAAAMSSWQ